MGKHPAFQLWPFLSGEHNSLMMCHFLGFGDWRGHDSGSGCAWGWGAGLAERPGWRWERRGDGSGEPPPPPPVWWHRPCSGATTGRLLPGGLPLRDWCAPSMSDKRDFPSSSQLVPGAPYGTSLRLPPPHTTICSGERKRQDDSVLLKQRPCFRKLSCCRAETILSLARRPCCLGPNPSPATRVIWGALT